MSRITSFIRGNYIACVVFLIVLYILSPSILFNGNRAQVQGLLVVATAIALVTYRTVFVIIGPIEVLCILLLSICLYCMGFGEITTGLSVCLIAFGLKGQTQQLLVCYFLVAS